MMCFGKDKEGHMHHCIHAGCVLFLVGLIYILKDLGYLTSFKIGMWPLLVFLIGLKFLICGMGCGSCRK